MENEQPEKTGNKRNDHSIINEIRDKTTEK